MGHVGWNTCIVINDHPLDTFANKFVCFLYKYLKVWTVFSFQDCFSEKPEVGGI